MLIPKDYQKPGGGERREVIPPGRGGIPAAHPRAPESRSLGPEYRHDLE